MQIKDTVMAQHSEWKERVGVEKSLKNLKRGRLEGDWLVEEVPQKSARGESPAQNLPKEASLLWANNPIIVLLLKGKGENFKKEKRERETKRKERKRREKWKSIGRKVNVKDEKILTIMVEVTFLILEKNWEYKIIHYFCTIPFYILIWISY